MGVVATQVLAQALASLWLRSPVRVVILRASVEATPEELVWAPPGQALHRTAFQA